MAYLICGIAALSIGTYYAKATDEGKRIYIVTAYALKAYAPLGIYFIVCSLLGFLVALAPLRRKRLLHGFVFALGLITLIMFCISIWIWTRTLNINGLYALSWRNEWSDVIKDAFQRDGSCCGFLSPADSPFMASASCQNTSIDYGCMYTVIFYAQKYHRLIYAGLIIFKLIGVGAMVSGIILLGQCRKEERLKRAYVHYWARKARRYNNSLEDTAVHEMHEMQTMDTQ
ncbi:hypothetical protein GGF37_005945, partial [Kickxella alabastrina]